MGTNRLDEMKEEIKIKKGQDDHNKDESKDINNNDDKIILENKNKIENKLKRKTYYLEQKHIDMIERLKKKSGYSKYELVQLAIEILYDRAKIK